MDKQAIKTKAQLGMPGGTASNRLRKSIMYHLAKRLNEHYCFQCGLEIESIEDFTIEHKTPWLDSEDPKKLFFRLENVAFSHHYCNVSAARRVKSSCPSKQRYEQGCRCEACVLLNRKRANKSMTKHRKDKKDFGVV